MSGATAPPPACRGTAEARPGRKARSTACGRDCAGNPPPRSAAQSRGAAPRPRPAGRRRRSRSARRVRRMGELRGVGRNDRRGNNAGRPRAAGRRRRSRSARRDESLRPTALPGQPCASAWRVPVYPRRNHHEVAPAPPACRGTAEARPEREARWTAADYSLWWTPPGIQKLLAHGLLESCFLVIAIETRSKYAAKHYLEDIQPREMMSAHSRSDRLSAGRFAGTCWRRPRRSQRPRRPRPRAAGRRRRSRSARCSGRLQRDCQRSARHCRTNS